MRPTIRFTILLAAALVPGLSGCGDSPAAPAARSGSRPIPPPSATTDTTQCLSGYVISNGIVTCEDPG